MVTLINFEHLAQGRATQTDTVAKGQGAGNIGAVGILGRSFPYRRRQCN